MIKKKLFKFASVFMCAAIMACSLAACKTDTAYNRQEAVRTSQASAPDTQSTIENAIYSQLLGTSAVNTATTRKANAKEETVFVFTDESGTQDHLIINEKLKNVTGLTSIKDFTTLKNISNLTGDETSTFSENTVTWAAGGNSITYQGTSDETVPVTMKVTYYLDGREISAQELAGRSGKVTMRFDYTNQAQETITVNGKQQTACVPFTMITGLLLPADKFENVEVTNGKIVEANDSNVVLGITMPGFKDSLNLNFEGKGVDINIPEHFEVTADVTDFELEMTLSVATSNVISKLNLDDLSLSDMKEDISTLTDAGDALADGASQLAAGTEALGSGMSELTGKIPQLTDGVAKLEDGASQLTEGAAQLMDGTAQVGDGAKELRSGIYAYADGVGQLSAGAASLDDKMTQYASAFSQLYTTLVDNELDKNLSQLAAGASGLSEGLNGAGGLSMTLKNGMASYQHQYDTAYKAAYELLVNASVAQQTGGAPLTQAQHEAVEAAVRQALADKGIAETPDISDTDSENKPVNQMTCMAAGLCGLYTSYSAAGAAENANQTLGYLVTITQTSGAYRTMAAIQSTLETAGLYSGAGTIAAGLAKLQQSVGTFSTYQEGTLCSSLYALNVNAQSLRQEGTQALNGGLAALNGKNNAIMGGADALNTGIAQLSFGVSALSAGAVQLKDGTVQLESGAAALSDGAGLLQNGVWQLNEGAVTLRDGMIEFNETAIGQLAGLIGTDADNAVETLKQIIQLGRDYQSFAGKPDDMEGSVTFIYKTQGISK